MTASESSAGLRIDSMNGWLDSPDLLAALAEGELDVEGRLAGASNGTMRCLVEVASGTLIRCVYKPVRGERPLWDFPDGTLSGREVAAHAISTALGWQIVPPTLWREDGPAGPGMCQAWIDEGDGPGVVAVLPEGSEMPGWISVFSGYDGAGDPVALVHAQSEALQQVAVFDALVNNADRKGGHLLVDEGERLWAIDHGVTFSDEDKLRTVLWGWAGQPIPADLLACVAALPRVADLDDVCRWLDRVEIRALQSRIDDLLADPVFPMPSPGWPAIPWPVF
jgi:uncharacterized repeat protein (TIGR03843 family)